MTSSTPIYEWSGDYFCAGCIVYTMVNHEPYCLWTQEEGNEIANQGTPATLNLMRTFLTNKDVAFEMPRRLRRPPLGVHVCATCLSFITEPINEEPNG